MPRAPSPACNALNPSTASRLCASSDAPVADEAAPSWFVYLLECEDGSLYTGVAIDVTERFIKHALGLGAAYTRSHAPLRVLACRGYANRGDALRAEYALKQRARKDKLTFFTATERISEAHVPALRRPAAQPRLKLNANGAASR